MHVCHIHALLMFALCMYAVLMYSTPYLCRHAFYTIGTGMGYVLRMHVRRMHVRRKYARNT
jgi:hypothetical protein